MGAWSETIMGSDSALDAEGDIIIDICGIDHDNWLDNTPVDFRNEIEMCIPKVMEKYGMKLDGDLHIMVLGVLILNSGSAVPLNVINAIIAATELIEDADTYTHPEKRTKYLKDFIKSVRNYDSQGGTPMEIANEGLFEVMMGLN